MQGSSVGEMEERLCYNTERRTQHKDRRPNVISENWRNCDYS